MPDLPKPRWRYADLAPPRLSLPVWAMVSFALVALSIFADDWGMRLHGELPPVVVGFFQAITRWGQADWLLIPSGCLLIWILLRRGTLSDVRTAVKARRVAAVTGLVFCAFAFTGIVSLLAKYLIGRERPGLSGEGLWRFVGPTFDPVYAAFPSGHATTMATLALLAVVLFTGWRRAAIIVFAVLVALSRIAIGAHHVSDVTAGWLVGLWGGWWMLWIFARLEIALRATAAPLPRARPVSWSQFVAVWRALWPPAWRIGRQASQEPRPD